VGTERALLLGPLAVKPAHKNLGIGRKLVAISTEAAAKAGHAAVILVGDAPYYGPLGFARVPAGRIFMPWPVDPARLLCHEIAPGILERLRGDMRHANLAAPTCDTTQRLPA
jgi:predicted N-acetyltransferase YhbS